MFLGIKQVDNENIDRNVETLDCCAVQMAWPNDKMLITK